MTIVEAFKVTAGIDEKIRLNIAPAGTVSALVRRAAKSNVCFVFAHGAGAGMTHSFMQAVADGLASRGITTIRYQFPYMEAGSKRPDTPAVAQSAVRAAVAEAARRFPRHLFIAGGKSFGGRMTSQAQAITPMPPVSGLAFFGFPLHPAGKPSVSRAEHLTSIHIPMLFLQGMRDKLADLTLLRPITTKLAKRAKLVTFEHADHSFHVPARSGKTDQAVLEEILDAFAVWARALKPSA